LLVLSPILWYIYGYAAIFPVLDALFPNNDARTDLAEADKTSAEPSPSLAEADKTFAEPSPSLAEADKTSAEPSLSLAEADKTSAEPSPDLAEAFDACDRLAVDLHEILFRFYLYKKGLLSYTPISLSTQQNSLILRVKYRISTIRLWQKDFFEGQTGKRNPCYKQADCHNRQYRCRLSD
jgi:hypothetical protein